MYTKRSAVYENYVKQDETLGHVLFAMEWHMLHAM